MNSILQAMFFSLKFRTDVLQLDHEKYQEKAAVAAAEVTTNSSAAAAGLMKAAPTKLTLYFQSPLMQLQKLFALLLKSARPYITPSAFRNTLPDYFRKSFMQQDASEFFKVLSDSLERDSKVLCNEPSENIFDKHFENKMQVKIECMDCSYTVCKEEQFVDLFIPIDAAEGETYGDAIFSPRRQN